MELQLPRITNLLYDNGGNEVWQYFGGEYTIFNIRIISINPFIIESASKNYLLISDKNYQDDDANEYILLTSKKPSKTDLVAGQIKIKRWLKHPSLKNYLPEEVVSTWNDKFKFVKENEQESIKGLRPPQIGALYSITTGFVSSLF